MATFNALKPCFDLVAEAARAAGWEDYEIAAAFMNYGVGKTVRAGLPDDEVQRVLSGVIELRNQLLNGF